MGGRGVAGAGRRGERKRRTARARESVGPTAARRWVVERSFAWLSRFRRLARDYERLPSVLAGLHFLACACLMLHQLIHLYSSL
jgi:transposase